MSVDIGYHGVVWKRMMAIRIAKRAKLWVGVFTVDCAGSGIASLTRLAAVFEGLLPASAVLLAGGDPCVEAPDGEHSTFRGFRGCAIIDVRGAGMKSNTGDE